MMRIRITGYFLLLICFNAYPQQDPISSQYMYNPLTFNPSYAGINDVTNVSFNSRFQWNNFEGAPTTFSLAANTSIVGGKVGLGVMLLNDQIGVSENTEMQVSYAYKIGNGKKTFSFGLQTGFIYFTKDIEALNLRVFDDPLFQPEVEKATKFNVGAGISYMTDNLFLSLSVPRMINSRVNNGVEIIAYERHAYLLGAYLFEIKPGLKMKPSVLIRAVSGAPVSFDVNVSFLINNQFWVGAYTRNLSSYGVMTQFEFLDAYKIGYAFELLGTDLKNNAYLTHEIMLSADFALFNHQSIYQRFF